MPCTIHSRPNGVIAIGAAALLSLFIQQNPRAQSTSVIWTNLVNATANGTSLRKTGGCDGCDNAGASSWQRLTAGDGYVEFVVGEMGTQWAAGLSHGDDAATYADIDFAVHFNGAGLADVLENGVHQIGGDAPYVVGDIFRIAVAGGRVQYSRNGQPILSSAKTPTYPLLLDASLATIGATVANASLNVRPPPASGGGFFEKAGSPALRPRLTAPQISGFLPPLGARGRFTFPAPYNTAGIRLTNSSDCGGGQDCVWYTGYSYWRNINNHLGSSDMYIFLGMDANRGGAGPSLIRYNKVTDAVDNLGPLFAPTTPYYWSTGEGWYFSATQPTKLYTLLVGDTRLRRFDILTRQFDPISAMDLNLCPKPEICPSNGAYIRQAHSSDDDQAHSATVQDSAWNLLGCVTARGSQFAYFPALPGSIFDECHIDKSGRWLMLLETRADGSEINRVADLTTGGMTVIEDAQGALGHLDMGYGYAVGADNYNPSPNATILLRFPVTTTTRPVGPVVHSNKRWDIVAANHIAHGNAANLRPETQYACGSHASRVADMADEVVCFSLDSNRNADRSLDVLVVAPIMTDLNAAGGSYPGSSDYEKLPKGNLDVSGRYFIWTTNLGGGRLDAFLVKVPGERLTAEQPNGISSEFDSDNRSDLLWRHSSGAVTVWFMNGTQVVGGGGIGANDPAWQVAGTGDFNADGRIDILWRNSIWGDVTMWFAGGGIPGSSAVASVDLSWQIVGTGDFDGDGHADILWRHTSGATTIWLMNGSQIVGGGQVAAVDPAWRIVGTGDFNGDGHADVLWRHTSGAVTIWLMNGARVVGGGQVATVDPAWQIVGTGDFNGDGHADLLWRHTSGAVTIWLMNDTRIIGGGQVAVVDPAWQIAGSGDYNGDGHADLLWRHTTGAVTIWFMNGTQVVGGGGVATVDPAWQIVHTP